MSHWLDAHVEAQAAYYGRTVKQMVQEREDINLYQELIEAGLVEEPVKHDDSFIETTLKGIDHG